MSIEKSESHDYILPVIVCPHCGEKDPAKLKLSSTEQTINNNLEEYWGDPYGPPRYFSNSITESMRILGNCFTCGASFNISISANIPRDKPLMSK